MIIALRHIHLSLDQAKDLGLEDKQIVCVRVSGERGIVFENVLVRAGAAYNGEIHLDTDEGNAAGLGPDAMGEILK